MRIDLNADLGESWPRWESGEDIALLDVVTSANVCCGAYAGDADLMRATCDAAVARGVAIGAQVGYPDRENFGRIHLEIPPAELTDDLLSQILLLDEIAKAAGVKVLILSHLTQAGLPFFTPDAFTRGVDAVFSPWRLARDGMTIELPVGSTEIRYGQF